MCVCVGEGGVEEMTGVLTLRAFFLTGKWGGGGDRYADLECVFFFL